MLRMIQKSLARTRHRNHLKRNMADHFPPRRHGYITGHNYIIVDDSTEVGPVDYMLCDLLWDEVAAVQLASATEVTSPS